MIGDSGHTLTNVITRGRIGADPVLGIFQERWFEIHLTLFLLWWQLFVRNIFFDSLGFNFNLVSFVMFLGAEINGLVILFITFQRVYGAALVLVWLFECHISYFIFLEPVCILRPRHRFVWHRSLELEFIWAFIACLIDLIGRNFFRVLNLSGVSAALCLLVITKQISRYIWLPPHLVSIHLDSRLLWSNFWAIWIIFYQKLIWTKFLHILCKK